MQHVPGAGGTRTCIHTPAAPLGEAEIPDAQVAAALQGAALVYFDGRLAEAAVRVALAARLTCAHAMTGTSRAASRAEP